jgi:hypothetical protein
LFRGVCSVAVVLALAASAFAQSVVRGKVQDAQGKPVEGATIVFEAEGTNRKMQTNTDKKGEFLQVGLASGPYKVTASKDGVGASESKANVRQGPNNPLSFTLAPAGASVKLRGLFGPWRTLAFDSDAPTPSFDAVTLYGPDARPT